MTHDPTPEQRAEVVVRRLEQFIRDGRTPYGGMPFRKWQDMARAEIEAAILESERVWKEDRDVTVKALAVGAAAVVTIGFWGTAVTFGSSPDYIDDALMLFAGGFLLFGAAGVYAIWRAVKRIQSGRRLERLTRVANMDRQLKALDKDLEKRVKDLADALDEIVETLPQKRARAELEQRMSRSARKRGTAPPA